MNGTESTLAGVALGAGLTGAISYALSAINFRRDKAERRRAERIDVITRFQRHVDELWRSRQDLAAAVLEIQGDKKNEAGWERRAAAFEEGRPARHEATLMVAQMRLIAPELVSPAEALLEVSERADMMKFREDRVARQDAQSTFESVARSLIV